MPFVPHTEQERQAMLETIGVASIDELFLDIPPAVRLQELKLPEGLAEPQLYAHLRGLAAANRTDLVSFLGGGFYDHAIPAAVDALSSRGEFLTAYTPYQAEVSQGTLQAIFEYQSMICRLTGLDAANASMYDGGTALAEAIMMATRVTGRNRIILCGGLNPTYRAIIKGFTGNLELEYCEPELEPGAPLNPATLQMYLDQRVAAVVAQVPDFYGTVNDLTPVAELAHQAGALLISSSYPLALGLLKRPGAMGVDIATGEGQSLGLPLSFGGPYLGYFAVRQALLRKMPGRVVGETLDRHGQRCYVLTLQAREQHIRREKATSNICTNQSLCALRAAIYLTLLGGAGLREVATLCARKSAYLQQRLSAITGVSLRNQAAFFNEFVIELPRPANAVVTEMLAQGYIAGLPLSRYHATEPNALLVAVTEQRTQEQLDGLAQALQEVLR